MWLHVQNSGGERAVMEVLNIKASRDYKDPNSADAEPEVGCQFRVY